MTDVIDDRKKANLRSKNLRCWKKWRMIRDTESGALKF
jgi:hypothetical protein